MSSLTGMFIGLHAMAAMQTQTPELAITEEEGKAWMKACQNVLRHYSVETTQKTLDIVALMGITVGMYGTRFVAIANRRRMEPARPGRGAEVHQLRPVRSPPGSTPAAPFAMDLGATLQTGFEAAEESGF